MRGGVLQHSSSLHCARCMVGCSGMHVTWLTNQWPCPGTGAIRSVWLLGSLADPGTFSVTAVMGLPATKASVFCAIRHFSRDIRLAVGVKEY